MSTRPTIVVTERLDDSAAAWLTDRARVIHCSSDATEFSEALSSAVGLVVRTYTQVDDALLDRAPLLRVVGRAGVGVDNIDLSACARRGIPVVHTPDANSQAVTEFITALVFDAIRPRCRVTAPLPLAEWNRLRSANVGRRQLDELIVGVLGFGRIGRRVGRTLSAFGGKVQYFDVAEVPESDRAGARSVDRETLFRTSDILTVHVDGRSSNRMLLGPAEFEMMKPDAILINTARGFVIDAPALARHLSRVPEFRAFLDVHEPEPLPADHPLLRQPNAVLTPHIAGRTDRALARMSEVVFDVMAVLEGREPRYPVGASAME
ncbi:MAG: NAD(P)-dependent oxidoreductase [Phycisphaerales bacterium]